MLELSDALVKLCSRYYFVCTHKHSHVYVSNGHLIPISPLCNNIIIIIIVPCVHIICAESSRWVDFTRSSDWELPHSLSSLPMPCHTLHSIHNSILSPACSVVNSRHVYRRASVYILNTHYIFCCFHPQACVVDTPRYRCEQRRTTDRKHPRL